MRNVLSTVALAAATAFTSSFALADNGLVTVCPKITMVWVLGHTWAHQPDEFYAVFADYTETGSAHYNMRCTDRKTTPFDLSEGWVAEKKWVETDTFIGWRKLVVVEVVVNGKNQFALFER